MLVDQRVEAELLERLSHHVQAFFSDDPRASKDYGRIVNQRHHQRLMRLAGNGRRVVGGAGNESERHITVVLTDAEQRAIIEYLKTL